MASASSLPFPVLEPDQLPPAPGLGPALREAGAVLVRGVDVADDRALLDVVGRAAEPAGQGEAGDVLVFDVTPKPDGGDLSSTRQEFDLHTDSTFMAVPHDVIALGCQRAAPGGGGRSLVVRIDAVVHELRRRDEQALEVLQRPAFPFALKTGEGVQVGLLPVLEQAPDGWRVRYRGDITARLVEHGVAVDDEAVGALAAFRAAASRCAELVAFDLEPGDVLLVDNRRALHGRTAIADDADRLLRRVKAAWPSPGGAAPPRSS